MDYEKKYKEALEKARDLYLPSDSALLEEIFPELKESEGERIRKALINMFKGYNIQKVGDFTDKEIIAWLEKQDEANPYSGVSFEFNGHTFGMCARDGGAEILMDGNLKAFISLDKSFIYPVISTPLLKDENFYVSKVDGLLHDMTIPPDKTESKFKVGDWIVFNGLTLYIKEVVKGYYRTVSIDDIPNSYDWDIDNIARLWGIQDAKEGDVLTLSYAYQNYILIYKGLYRKSFQTMMSIFCSYYVEEDAYEDETDSFHQMNTGEIITPATKEQRDTLMKAMADAGYTFDFDKKEFNEIRQKPIDKDESVINILNKENKQVQQEDLIMKPSLNTKQNTAWSEEDNKNLEKTIWYVEKGGKLIFAKTDELVSWLKSLKGRVGCEANCTTMWKPSEEQIDALEQFISEYKDIDDNNRAYPISHIIESLYNDLKKLTE